MMWIKCSYVNRSVSVNNVVKRLCPEDRNKKSTVSLLPEICNPAFSNIYADRQFLISSLKP